MKKKGRPKTDSFMVKDTRITIRLDYNTRLKLAVIAAHYDIGKADCIRKLINDRYEAEQVTADE